jgi:hypothetical protein
MPKAFVFVSCLFLATTGSALSQTIENAVIGNTLQAKYILRSKVCTNSGTCRALPVRHLSENIYFSPNGNAYDFGTENRGGIFPFNEMVKQGAISKGYFLRRNIVEYRATDKELTASFLYKMAGQKCTVSRHTKAGSDLRVNSTIELDFCRLVTGRVER